VESEHTTSKPTPHVISVILPTYGREEVLVDTLKCLIALPPERKEILVVDQTPKHQDDTEKQLFHWNEENKIRWIKRPKPSIPAAMNCGAKLAKSDLLLYLDDDIIPDENLLTAHIAAHHKHLTNLVAGRVLQPWDKPETPSSPFAYLEGRVEQEFMGGNFSISRSKLMELGGFDENFKGAAYRFEREFADRLTHGGGTIWFEPGALIHHLYFKSGGTRSKGDHLHSWNPRHPVGAYYYIFVSNRVTDRAWEVMKRFAGSIKTRHHLRKPWYIPITLFSEFSGLLWAAWLRLMGPELPLKTLD
jgi:GT2 family glycosyltransferase